ncbi:hypothetical protein KPH14_011967 [Odynerus spinipes]|uniref:DUF4789 domain-containing protein n=1 Tax=Odynerus spinipes TaxID=1348599 RepID=A0AAD9RC60_9HYME|nr:hypothetical protein KPH14_011967 [Odynerus spinipes]
MKWILFNCAFFISCYSICCQDILFPDDEEISHVSGNKQLITERIPVSIPGHCAKNMLLYPGTGNDVAWVCDCRPRFLYFPLNDSCHEAYRQGPCPPEHYVILPKGEAVPQCVKNPCLEDGLVQYNNTCYPLRTIGGPCAPNGVLGVNETNFQLECTPNEIAPFIIISAPERKCLPGTRRTALGMCKKPI